MGLALTGCTANSNPWTIDRIAAGDPSFDSSRIRFASSQPHSPLFFEVLKMGDRIEAFFSLTRFRFTPLKGSHEINILLTIEDRTYEALAPVHEGQMRLKIPQEMTQIMIQALQDGKKVAILVDGFEEWLDPQQFSPSFTKFLQEESFLQTLFKGPV